MRKRRLAVPLAAAAVSLSACSGGQTQENKTAQTSQATEAAEDAGTEAAGGTTEDADWASRAIEEGKVSSMEELTFPSGDQISGDFTGAAYLAPMIMNDETYHFPQTNNVTFEPGARSYWYSHGGMILVGTGGVGYYQEEGKPVQIIQFDEEIDELVRLDVKPSSYFTAGGVSNQHGGGARLFSRDSEIMSWLFHREKPLA